jgi:hypothetical protein
MSFTTTAVNHFLAVARDGADPAVTDHAFRQAITLSADFAPNDAELAAAVRAVRDAASELQVVRPG